MDSIRLISAKDRSSTSLWISHICYKSSWRADLSTC